MATQTSRHDSHPHIHSVLTAKCCSLNDEIVTQVADRLLSGSMNRYAHRHPEQMRCGKIRIVENGDTVEKEYLVAYFRTDLAEKNGRTKPKRGHVVVMYNLVGGVRDSF